MIWLQACNIIRNIDRHSKDEVLAAIEKMLDMATINAMSKDDLRNTVRWLHENYVKGEQAENAEAVHKV